LWRGGGKAHKSACVREDRVFQNVEPPYRGIVPGSLLALIGFVGLCLLVLTSNVAFMRSAGHAWYLSLNPPPLTPPPLVFAPVWTALYVLMGVAAWLVWRATLARAPLRLWGWQLLLNALWTPAFFTLHSPALAMLVIASLLALVLLTARAFARVDRLAMWLLAPYTLWLGFAAYLNAGFWWCNAI
jgi:tryptophan-rich sensory protein